MWYLTLGVAIKSLCGDDLSYDQMFCWSDKKINVLKLDQKQPPEVFFKKSFFEIWQNSQEKTCASLFFYKVEA